MTHKAPALATEDALLRRVQELESFLESVIAKCPMCEGAGSMRSRESGKYLDCVTCHDARAIVAKGTT